MNVILNVFQVMSSYHSDWSEAKWRNPLNNVSGKEQSLRDTSTSLRFAQYDKRESGVMVILNVFQGMSSCHC